MLWQVEPSGNCRKVSENNLFTSGEVSRYLQLTSCGLAESINRDSARYFIYGIGILILVILGYLNTLFWVTHALKRLSKAGNLFHSGYKLEREVSFTNLNPVSQDSQTKKFCNFWSQIRCWIGVHKLAAFCTPV